MSSFLTRYGAVLALAVFVMNPVSALAAVLPMEVQSSFEANEASWSSMNTGLGSLVSDTAALIKTIVILIGTVLLFIVVKDIIKGNKEGAEKMIWWVVGLAIILTLIEVLQKVKA